MRADDGAAVTAALRRIEGIIEISTLSGAFDMVVVLRAASLKQLDAALVKIRAIPAVAETHSQIRRNTFSR